MKKAVLAWLVVCVSGAIAQSTPLANPPAKECEELRIHYAAMDPKLADRVLLEPVDQTKPPGTPRTSPQHTRWVLASAPDYSKIGPWNTPIWIGEGDDKTTLKLTLKQHEGFSIEWLNEKLLYGSISWSKTLNTVFILDVENKKFLYREMEDASEMNEPCD
jgi:hypothetical protein